MPSKEISEQFQDTFLRHTLFLQRTRESIKRLGWLSRGKRGLKTIDIFGAVHGASNARPEGRGAEVVEMQTGRAIPRPLQDDGWALFSFRFGLLRSGFPGPLFLPASRASRRHGVHVKLALLIPEALLVAREQKVLAAIDALEGGINIPVSGADRIVLLRDVSAHSRAVIDGNRTVKQVQRHLLWIGVAKNVHINSERQRTPPNARDEARRAKRVQHETAAQSRRRLQHDG